MTKDRTAPLGMLFVNTNRKTGTKFLSGFLEIDGEKIQVIANKAKKVASNGKEFYVLFENDTDEDLVEVPIETVVNSPEVLVTKVDEAPF